MHMSDWPSGPPSPVQWVQGFFPGVKGVSVGHSQPVLRLKFGNLCSMVSIVSIPLAVWSGVQMPCRQVNH